MKRLCAYIITLLALTAAACGGDSPDPDPVGPGPTVASVTITPNGGTIAPRQTLQLAATPRDAQGGTVPGASVTWNSSASSVATVDASGLVMGVGPGETTITATSGGRGGNVVVSVSEPEEVPEIGALVPAAIPADAGDTELTVEGTGFSTSSIVHWNGAARPTTYESPIRLVAEIPAADVVSVGTAVVSVVKGTTASASLEFVIGPRVHGVTLSDSDTHTCGVTTDGAALCWGANSDGSLGTGDRDNRTTPALVAGGHAFATIAVGAFHTCALTRAGEAWCWGSDTDGELGNGPASNVGSDVPVPVAGGHRFTTISALSQHTCGITPTGEVLCWGRGQGGILGHGGTESRSEPTPVADHDRYHSISVGSFMTCGITTDGTGKCWGSGWLGIDSSAGALVPTPVAGGHTFTTISAGSALGCGITSSGEAWCWGLGSDGQLGNGLLANANTPVKVSGNHTFRSIFTSFSYACGVTTSNAGLCWGGNISGQLGNGTMTPRSVPTPISGGHAFARISGTCGVTIAGAVWCWGNKPTATLGDGHTTRSAVPIRVAPDTEFAVEAALVAARRQ